MAFDSRLERCFLSPSLAHSLCVWVCVIRHMSMRLYAGCAQSMTLARSVCESLSVCVCVEVINAPQTSGKTQPKMLAARLPEERTAVQWDRGTDVWERLPGSQ